MGSDGGLLQSLSLALLMRSVAFLWVLLRLLAVASVFAFPFVAHSDAFLPARQTNKGPAGVLLS